jgi:hypothetical protein
MRKIATPWGQATVVEEVVLPQQADGREFASLVQLLEGDDGAPLVRFAYTTDGSVRRGPVTLRLADVEGLRASLGNRKALARALGLRPRR